MITQNQTWHIIKHGSQHGNSLPKNTEVIIKHHILPVKVAGLFLLFDCVPLTAQHICRVDSTVFLCEMHSMNYFLFAL